MTNVEQYFHIMDKYRKGIYGDKSLHLNEILEKAGEPDLLDRMTSVELAAIRAKSSGAFRGALNKMIDERKNGKRSGKN